MNHQGSVGNESRFSYHNLARMTESQPMTPPAFNEFRYSGCLELNENSRPVISAQSFEFRRQFSKTLRCLNSNYAVAAKG